MNRYRSNRFLVAVQLKRIKFVDGVPRCGIPPRANENDEPGLFFALHCAPFPCPLVQYLWRKTLRKRCRFVTRFFTQAFRLCNTDLPLHEHGTVP